MGVGSPSSRDLGDSTAPERRERIRETCRSSFPFLDKEAGSWVFMLVCPLAYERKANRSNKPSRGKKSHKVLFQPQGINQICVKPCCSHFSKTAHLTVHNDALLAGPAFAVKIEYLAAALPHINKYPTRCPCHQPNELGGDSFATSRVRFCAFTS